MLLLRPYVIYNITQSAEQCVAYYDSIVLAHTVKYSTDVTNNSRNEITAQKNIFIDFTTRSIKVTRVQRQNFGPLSIMRNLTTSNKQNIGTVLTVTFSKTLKQWRFHKSALIRRSTHRY